MEAQKEPQQRGAGDFYGYTKINLLILLVSLLVIVIGYVLMSGGTSADGISFNSEVFSFRRIRIAPIVTTLGYLGIIIAILYRSKNR